MKAFALLPAAERQLYFEQTARLMRLSPQIIEKDFWVCWMLNELFALPEAGRSLTFKGGTSLSKVFKVIERFSEDIDLVIDREFLGFGGDADPENAPSKKKRREWLEELKRACSNYVNGDLTGLLQPALSESLGQKNFTLYPDPFDPDKQSLIFEYPTCWMRPESAYVRPAVKIEFGARSDIWPNEPGAVTSYVAEKFPAAFAKAGCNVQALAVERTFWEKACLLHEENFRPNGKPVKPRLSRHYYDLFWLIQAGVHHKASSDLALFQRVVEHRSIFFSYAWVNYEEFKQGSLQLVPKAGRISEWADDYEKMTEMFFTASPSFQELMDSCDRFQRSFNHPAASA